MVFGRDDGLQKTSGSRIGAVDFWRSGAERLNLKKSIA